jgi:acetyltransferase-like isoleucine patch superfamily enzyme
MSKILNGDYRRFLNILNILNKLSVFRYHLKTILFYRYCFKSIGKGSIIMNPIFINNPQNIVIGDNVVVRDGVRIETVYSSPLRVPELVIGNNTNIEQNVHIICHNKVKIGANVSITGNCCIVDITHPYEDVESNIKIGNRILNEDSFVEIGEGSFIGFGSMILPNVKIGRHAVIGSNSVVSKDVPDYSVVAGMPAKIIKIYKPETGEWVKV